MRSITASLIISTTVLLTASSQAQEVLRIHSDRLYVPKGYDDNDRVQIVLDGVLKHSCDQLMAPEWQIDPNGHQIFVSARVLRDHTIECIEEQTMFTQVVEIGLLPMGKYRVWTNGGRLIATLPVAEAQSAGADDEYYAYLTDSYMEYDASLPADQGRWSIVLEGFFEDQCQDWDFVGLEVSTFMFEVFPVVTPPSLDCPQRIERFTKRVHLPEITAMGRYLVHVRSHGGEAFNEVFTVDSLR